MNYRIKRGDQEFGPYSLAELKQYISEGRIIPTDLAMSEGMEDWAPVSAVTGNVDVAVPLPGADTVQPGASPSDFIRPPDLHWALVLVITMVTCGIFGLVWIFVQAAWAKKADSKCNATLMFVFYIVGFAVYMAAILTENENYIVVGVLAYFVCVACYIIGIFSIRRAIHNYYKDAPFQLHLNGVLTFFFNVYYFQYHYNRITEWHKTGVFPQGSA
jgi:hypothetical protein